MDNWPHTLGCHVQRRQSILSLGADRSAFLQQKINHLIVSGSGGAVEWCEQIACSTVDDGAVGKKQCAQIPTPPFGGYVKGAKSQL